MDASKSGEDFIPDLKALKNQLDTSSDNEEEDLESGSELGKRDRPEQEPRTHQQLVLRKRDVKGNYKAKFNIEKLMIEHEKKKIQLEELNDKYREVQEQLNELRASIGKKVVSGDITDVKDKSSKCHWGFLIKEMKWMAEDFERETKKKLTDTKKQARACKKQIHEKKLKKEKELKDQKIEVRKKAVNMSRMVQQFWKSIEKVVKHNYNVLYEKKRQQIRTKKLEDFVSKHLKLSVKVAEELNTKSMGVKQDKDLRCQSHQIIVPKSFIEQSMHNKEDGSLNQQGKTDTANPKTIVKLYGSQDELYHQKEIDALNDVNNDIVEEVKPYKRQKVTVTVVKDKDGKYEVDGEYEQRQAMHSQILSQQQNRDDKQISRALIAEQTVEMAKSFQPQGFTLSSVKVQTKVPFLLQGELREYQIIGLDWLVTLHNKKLNGILADEMGLGKTIQTISMLASLACDKGIWGPHLIVVPTTIIINWEMEFKKWCPAFKILTYFGSQKERKMKRHGWSKDNSFHVCITSYKLVIQDHFAFRRKKWYYMILDEAQNIKNFKSQRWQTLLRFNTKRRLLLTGTPLQNDVMELWSLMHFLMPNIFSSQQDFKEWFSNPFNQSINQNQTLNITVVQKLQSILRPFLLRRMKRDVEKQLPEKVEHIVQCNLSRRQRLLYDEYINSDKTKQTLNDSDFFSIMNVLMQLRKVCNHPDLFEPRSIESPFIMQERIRYNFSSMIYKAFQNNPMQTVNLQALNFILTEFEQISKTEYEAYQELYPKRPLIQVIGENKNHIDDLSDHLLQTRPLADGLAIGKRLPINCNVLAKSNTKSLQHTLPTVLPFESNIYHEIPSYLNTACLPFAQHYYSLNNFNQMRYSMRNKEYSEIDHYLSALHSDEQRYQLIKFADKLVQWRKVDTTNRINLIFRKPVYGEDCRKAVKVNLLFGDVFDVKRHKNLDRDSKNSNYQIKDLETVPQTIFNPFAQRHYFFSDQKHILNGNIVEDWPELSEEQIEVYNSKSPFIKEVTASLQLKNKKKKKQLKEQIRIQQEEEQKKQLEQLNQAVINSANQTVETKQVETVVEEMIKYTEKEFFIIIDKKVLQNGVASHDQMEDIEVNPNVQVVVNEIEKERLETRVIIQEVPVHDQQQQMVQVAQEENESPYQKLYQNASKRYKKDGEPANGDGNQDQKMQFENQDQSSGVSTNIPPPGLNEESMRDEDRPQDPIPSATNRAVEQVQTKPSEEKKSEEGHSQPSNEKAIQPNQDNQQKVTYKNCEVLRDMIVTPLQRVQILEETIKHYKFIIPKAVAQTVDFVPTKIVTQNQKEKAYERFLYQKLMSHRNVNQSLKYSNILFFPHKNLIQYDCGKLQRLAQLLKNLHSKGHKVLIFTQMTRILDILENFLNLHGYTYVRLDGSVKVEMRQRLVDKFNLNKKIFCFISSTRCGGIGINLTGADCVIFYDTDWNPAMDKQAQDRCHRIGQTKTVHIYRLISVNTIEENIFKKSLQKRDFGGLIIEGGFDMEFFKKVSLKDVLEDENFFRPKRRDLMKEENIVFHTNTQNIGLGDDLEPEQVNELDFEKQREIEQYRKRFEEALVRIEDKEDVIALQQAKREIDDDFDEEAILAGQKQEGTTGPSSKIGDSNAGGQPGDEPMVDEVADGQNVTALDSKSAKQLQSELKKSEFINWRSHATLNEVTKMCIEYYENGFSFDQYLDERSKKDNKFVNPLKEDAEEEEEKVKEDEDQDGGSEFSFSEDDEIISGNEEEQQQMIYERQTAEAFYKRTREEIESKYFVL